MPAFRPLHRREDGSYVAEIQHPVHGVIPYHVTHADPLFAAVSAAAAGMPLAPEPPPPPAPGLPGAL